MGQALYIYTCIWKRAMFCILAMSLKPCMCGSRKFCQRGSNFDNFFFFFFFKLMRGEMIQIPLKVGHHRPASETPFKWRFAGGPMMAHIVCWPGSFVIFQRIWTSIAKKPYIFVILQGGSGPPCPPPPSGSAHALLCCL